MDEDLLIRFILGEANAAESLQVQQWIDESEENKAEFEKIRKVWSAAKAPQAIEPADVDVDAAWKKMTSRMSDYQVIEEKFEGRARSLSFYLLRVAAVLIVGMIIYAVYNFQSDQLSQVQLSSADSTSTNNELPDGTFISLNQNTTVQYDKKFDEEERRVKLSGEAFFDVESETNRPFVVETQSALITVLGTAFNVKALDEAEAVEVFVEEGLVELANPDRSQFLKLSVGEKGIYIKEANKVMRETEVDAESLYWLNKTLLFRDTELRDVFETLERLYEIAIEVDEESILKCQLTAKFSNESVNTILDHISTIFDFETEINEDRILIKGNGCQ